MFFVFDRDDEVFCRENNSTELKCFDAYDEAVEFVNFYLEFFMHCDIPKKIDIFYVENEFNIKKLKKAATLSLNPFYHVEYKYKDCDHTVPFDTTKYPQYNKVDTAQFSKLSIPLVKRIYPALLASSLVSVQPLLGPPNALKFYQKWRYSTVGNLVDNGIYYNIFNASEDRFLAYLDFKDLQTSDIEPKKTAHFPTYEDALSAANDYMSIYMCLGVEKTLKIYKNTREQEESPDENNLPDAVLIDNKRNSFDVGCTFVSEHNSVSKKY